MKIEEIISNKNDKKIVRIPMNLIEINMNINPRSELIQDTIDKLVDSGEFPEIHLGYVDGNLIIIDGYHRYSAAQRLEMEEILAYVTAYNNIEDAKLDAFKENVNHGVKLGEFDIAKWLYENYIDSMKKNSLITIREFTNKCGAPERRGGALYKWYLIHKGILEDNELEITRLYDMEEYYSMVVFEKEIVGDISEDFKIRFKNFYNKYKNLNRSELRKAINWYKEGKDYEEELEKEKEEMRREEELVEQMEERDRKEWLDGFDPIGSDAIDRSGIADYSSRETQETNKEIERLMNEHKDIKEEIENTVEEQAIEEKKIMADKLLDNLSKTLMSLTLFNAKGKIHFSQDNVNTLKDIKNRIDELLDVVKPEDLGEML